MSDFDGLLLKTSLEEGPDAPSDAVVLSLASLSFVVVRLMVVKLMVVKLMVVRFMVVKFMVAWLMVEKTLFAETPSEGCRCCPICTELGHGSLLLFTGLRSATLSFIPR